MQPQGAPLSVREGYDRWAPSYDAYDNPLVLLEEPVVVELAGDVRGRTVADVGCGTGRHAIRMHRAGARVTGVDGSPRMLTELRRKAPEIECAEQDLRGGIALPDAGFEIVLCCLVLEHVGELDRALAELARITAPGGMVIVSDLHPEQTRRGVHARFRESPEVKREIVGFHHTISDYVMAAQRAGLRIDALHERVMDEASAGTSASAGKYVGEPLLFAMRALRS
ncbi:MAG: class I SAM-dependent methyltransferase [Nannocystaceae bacterium]|nr:class I SAM-dependent methyltransferase [Nannocystaceae bacterium]